MKCMMGECGNEVGGNIWYVGGVVVRGDIKIQVLATARFCKLLQTVATTGLSTLSQVCQHLASSGRRALFPDAPLMTY